VLGKGNGNGNGNGDEDGCIRGLVWLLMRREDENQPRDPIRMDSHCVPTSAVTYATNLKVRSAVVEMVIMPFTRRHDTFRRKAKGAIIHGRKKNVAMVIIPLGEKA
jgi:hypothetical protein